MIRLRETPFVIFVLLVIINLSAATTIKDASLSNIALQPGRKSNILAGNVTEFRQDDIFFLEGVPIESRQTLMQLSEKNAGNDIRVVLENGEWNLKKFLDINSNNASFRLVKDNKIIGIRDLGQLLNVRQISYIRPTRIDIDGQLHTISDVVKTYGSDLPSPITVTYKNDDEYFFYEHQRIGINQLYNIIFRRPNYIYDFAMLDVNGAKLHFYPVMYTLEHIPNLQVIYNNERMTPMKFLDQYQSVFKGKCLLEYEGVTDELVDVFRNGLKYTITDYITLQNSMLHPYYAIESLQHLDNMYAWRPGPDQSLVPLNEFMGDIFQDEDPKQNRIQIFRGNTILTMHDLKELLIRESTMIFGDMSYAERLPNNGEYTILYQGNQYDIDAFLETYGRTNEYYSVMQKDKVLPTSELKSILEFNPKEHMVSPSTYNYMGVPFRLSEIAYNLAIQNPRHVTVHYNGVTYTPMDFFKTFKEHIPNDYKIMQNDIEISLDDVFHLIDVNRTPQFLKTYNIMNVPYNGQTYTKDDVLTAILENPNGFMISDHGLFRSPLSFKEHYGDNVPPFVAYYQDQPIKTADIPSIVNLESILEEEFYPILFNGHSYTPQEIVKMLNNQQPDKVKLLHKEKEYTTEEYLELFPSTKFKLLYNDYPIDQQDLEQIIDFDLQDPKSKLKFYNIKYRGVTYNKNDIIDILIRELPHNVKILHEGVFYAPAQFKRKFPNELPDNFAVVQNKRIIPSKLIPTVVRLGDSKQVNPKIFPNVVYNGKEYTADDILHLIISQNPPDVIIALNNRRFTPKEFEKTFDGVYPITFTIFFKNKVVRPEDIYNIVDFDAEIEASPRVIVQTTTPIFDEIEQQEIITDNYDTVTEGIKETEKPYSIYSKPTTISDDRQKLPNDQNEDIIYREDSRTPKDDYKPTESSNNYDNGMENDYYQNNVRDTIQELPNSELPISLLPIEPTKQTSDQEDMQIIVTTEEEPYSVYAKPTTISDSSEMLPADQNERIIYKEDSRTPKDDHTPTESGNGDGNSLENDYYLNNIRETVQDSPNSELPSFLSPIIPTNKTSDQEDMQIVVRTNNRNGESDIRIVSQRKAVDDNYSNDSPVITNNFPYIVNNGTLYTPHDVVQSLIDLESFNFNYYIIHDGVSYSPAKFIEKYQLEFPEDFEIFDNGSKMRPEDIANLIPLKNYGIIVNDGKTFPHIVSNGVIYTPEHILDCLANTPHDDLSILHQGQIFEPSQFKEKFNDKLPTDFTLLKDNNPVPPHELPKILNLEEKPTSTATPMIFNQEDSELPIVKPVAEDPKHFPNIVIDGDVFTPNDILDIMKEDNKSNLTILHDNTTYTPEEFVKEFDKELPEDFTILKDNQQIDPNELFEFLSIEASNEEFTESNSLYRYPVSGEGFSLIDNEQTSTIGTSISSLDESTETPYFPDLVVDSQLYSPERVVEILDNTNLPVKIIRQDQTYTPGEFLDNFENNPTFPNDFDVFLNTKHVDPEELPELVDLNPENNESGPQFPYIVYNGSVYSPLEVVKILAEQNPLGVMIHDNKTKYTPAEFAEHFTIDQPDYFEIFIDDKFVEPSDIPKIVDFDLTNIPTYDYSEYDYNAPSPSSIPLMDIYSEIQQYKPPDITLEVNGERFSPDEFGDVYNTSWPNEVTIYDHKTPVKNLNEFITDITEEYNFPYIIQNDSLYSPCEVLDNLDKNGIPDISVEHVGNTYTLNEFINLYPKKCPENIRIHRDTVEITAQEIQYTINLTHTRIIRETQYFPAILKDNKVYKPKDIINTLVNKSLENILITRDNEKLTPNEFINKYQDSKFSHLLVDNLKIPHALVPDVIDSVARDIPYLNDKTTSNLTPWKEDNIKEVKTSQPLHEPNKLLEMYFDNNPDMRVVYNNKELTPEQFSQLNSNTNDFVVKVDGEIIPNDSIAKIRDYLTKTQPQESVPFSNTPQEIIKQLIHDNPNTRIVVDSVEYTPDEIANNWDSQIGTQPGSEELKPISTTFPTLLDKEENRFKSTIEDDQLFNAITKMPSSNNENIKSPLFEKKPGNIIRYPPSMDALDQEIESNDSKYSGRPEDDSERVVVYNDADKQSNPSSMTSESYENVDKTNEENVPPNMSEDDLVTKISYNFLTTTSPIDIQETSNNTRNNGRPNKKDTTRIVKYNTPNFQSNSKIDIIESPEPSSETDSIEDSALMPTFSDNSDYNEYVDDIDGLYNKQHNNPKSENIVVKTPSTSWVNEDQKYPSNKPTQQEPSSPQKSTNIRPKDTVVRESDVNDNFSFNTQLLEDSKETRRPSRPSNSRDSQNLRIVQLEDHRVSEKEKPFNFFPKDDNYPSNINGNPEQTAQRPLWPKKPNDTTETEPNYLPQKEDLPDIIHPYNEPFSEKPKFSSDINSVNRKPTRRPSRPSNNRDQREHLFKPFDTDDVKVVPIHDIPIFTEIPNLDEKNQSSLKENLVPRERRPSRPQKGNMWSMDKIKKKPDVIDYASLNSEEQDSTYWLNNQLPEYTTSSSDAVPNFDIKQANSKPPNYRTEKPKRPSRPANINDRTKHPSKPIISHDHRVVKIESPEQEDNKWVNLKPDYTDLSSSSLLENLNQQYPESDNYPGNYKESSVPLMQKPSRPQKEKNNGQNDGTIMEQPSRGYTDNFKDRPQRPSRPRDSKDFRIVEYTDEHPRIDDNLPAFDTIPPRHDIFDSFSQDSKDISEELLNIYLSNEQVSSISIPDYIRNQEYRRPSIYESKHPTRSSVNKNQTDQLVETGKESQENFNFDIAPASTFKPHNNKLYSKTTDRPQRPSRPNNSPDIRVVGYTEEHPRNVDFPIIDLVPSIHHLPDTSSKDTEQPQYPKYSTNYEEATERSTSDLHSYDENVGNLPNQENNVIIRPVNKVDFDSADYRLVETTETSKYFDSTESEPGATYFSEETSVDHSSEETIINESTTTKNEVFDKESSNSKENGNELQSHNEQTIEYRPSDIRTVNSKPIDMSNFLQNSDESDSIYSNLDKNPNLSASFTPRYDNEYDYSPNLEIIKPSTYKPDITRRPARPTNNDNKQPQHFSKIIETPDIRVVQSINPDSSKYSPYSVLSSSSDNPNSENSKQEFDESWLPNYSSISSEEYRSKEEDTTPHDEKLSKLNNEGKVSLLPENTKRPTGNNRDRPQRPSDIRIVDYTDDHRITVESPNTNLLHQAPETIIDDTEHLQYPKYSETTEEITSDSYSDKNVGNVPTTPKKVGEQFSEIDSRPNQREDVTKRPWNIMIPYDSTEYQLVKTTEDAEISSLFTTTKSSEDLSDGKKYLDFVTPDYNNLEDTDSSEMTPNYRPSKTSQSEENLSMYNTSEDVSGKSTSDSLEEPISVDENAGISTNRSSMIENDNTMTIERRPWNQKPNRVVQIMNEESPQMTDFYSAEISTEANPAFITPDNTNNDYFWNNPNQEPRRPANDRPEKQTRPTRPTDYYNKQSHHTARPSYPGDLNEESAKNKESLPSAYYPDIENSNIPNQSDTNLNSIETPAIYMPVQKPQHINEESLPSSESSESNYTPVDNEKYNTPPAHSQTTSSISENAPLIIKEGVVFDELDIIEKLVINNIPNVKILYLNQQYSPFEFIQKFPNNKPENIKYIRNGQSISPYEVISHLPIYSHERYEIFPNVIMDGITYKPKDIVRLIKDDQDGGCVAIVHHGQLYTAKEFYTKFADKSLFPNDFSVQVANKIISPKNLLSLLKLKGIRWQEASNSSIGSNPVQTYIKKMEDKRPSFEVVYKDKVYAPESYLQTYGPHAPGNFKIKYNNHLFTPRNFYQHIKEQEIKAMIQKPPRFGPVQYNGRTYSPRTVVQKIAEQQPKDVRIVYNRKFEKPEDFLKYSNRPSNFLIMRGNNVVLPSDIPSIINLADVNSTEIKESKNRTKAIESFVPSRIVFEGETYTPELIAQSLAISNPNNVSILYEGEIYTPLQFIAHFDDIPRKFKLVDFKGKVLDPKIPATYLKITQATGRKSMLIKDSFPSLIHNNRIFSAEDVLRNVYMQAPQVQIKLKDGNIITAQKALSLRPIETDFQLMLDGKPIPPKQITSIINLKKYKTQK